MLAGFLAVLAWLARAVVMRLGWLWLRIGVNLLPWLRSLFSKQMGPLLFILLLTWMQWRLASWLVSDALAWVWQSQVGGLGVNGVQASIYADDAQHFFFGIIGLIDYCINLQAWLTAAMGLLSLWMAAVQYRAIVFAAGVITSRGRLGQ